MQYLEFKSKQGIKIDTPTIKKNIGKRVIFMKRGGFSFSYGTITEFFRKQIDFGNGDFIPFNRIEKIILNED